MTNNQSKMSKKRFGLNYNSRKLSVKTRIEIIRKRHLIKKAKKLLQKGIDTPIPTPASLQDECESVVSIEVLAEILETTRNYEKQQTLLEYHPLKKALPPIASSSDENYDSDEYEPESMSEDSEDSEEAEKKCLVDERPELVEI
jgi:hypothetical protein